MLVLHVRVEGRVGEVGLIAVVAAVVPALDIVLRPTFLLLFVVLTVIVPGIAGFPAVLVMGLVFGCRQAENGGRVRRWLDL